MACAAGECDCFSSREATSNVAELVTTPKGTDGRPSKALNRHQAQAVLKAAASSELHAYVVISLTTGIRTEEARGVMWSPGSAYGYRDWAFPNPESRVCE
ncbi:hypothetical protein ACIBG4_16035 [Nonomuraea sp. NPDC050383]|uniref:hypothetical protein n=1 Tax=Nonomuraea sp. NPDC050383 TaxID=3364362 RepID=UPI0037970C8F